MEMVIDRQILPEPIYSYIHSEKIRIFEENGNVVLSPLNKKPNIDELFGIFNDGKLSSNGFIKQKSHRRRRWLAHLFYCITPSLIGAISLTLYPKIRLLA